MKKVRIIRMIVGFIGFIGLLICGIWAIVLHVQNPDMTEMRLFLEFPQVTIISIICAVIGFVGIDT